MTRLPVLLYLSDFGWLNSILHIVTGGNGRAEHNFVGSVRMRRGIDFLGVSWWSIHRLECDKKEMHQSLSADAPESSSFVYRLPKVQYKVCRLFNSDSASRRLWNHSGDCGDWRCVAEGAWRRGAVNHIVEDDAWKTFDDVNIYADTFTSSAFKRGHSTSSASLGLCSSTTVPYLLLFKQM